MTDLSEEHKRSATINIPPLGGWWIVLGVGLYAASMAIHYASNWHLIQASPDLAQATWDVMISTFEVVALNLFIGWLAGRTWE